MGLGSDTFGEISAFGGPQDDRVRAQMLDEGLAVLTGLWSGESFSFSGNIFISTIPASFRRLCNSHESRFGLPVPGRTARHFAALPATMA